MRGGTVYWAGSFTATPPTLVRTDSRYIRRARSSRRSTGSARTAPTTRSASTCTASSTRVSGSPPSRAWRPPSGWSRNYATDPTTKEYVDKLNIFILPVVNPDGGHAAFHDNSVQRKNLTNYCPIDQRTTGYVANRNAWGVDLNRNNTVGSLFDGYAGASTALHERDLHRPVRGLRAGDPQRALDRDTFKGIKFANNIHTHGGYFMWAPGAYKSAGRVTLPAPNIGIEKYFFEVADTILSHIRSSRNTAILPQRTGPIADALYSAAGNSADEQYYRAASSPTRSRRARSGSRSTRRRARSRAPRSASSRASPGRAPTAARAHVRHGRRAERAAGQRGPRLHDGVRRGQLRRDPGRAGVPQRRHARRRRRSSTPPRRRRRPDQLQVQLAQRAVGHLLHDRRHDAGHVADDPHRG